MAGRETQNRPNCFLGAKLGQVEKLKKGRISRQRAAEYYEKSFAPEETPKIPHGPFCVVPKSMETTSATSQGFALASRTPPQNCGDDPYIAYKPSGAFRFLARRSQISTEH